MFCFFIDCCVEFVFDDVLCKFEFEFFFLNCSWVWEFCFEGGFGCVVIVLEGIFWGLIKCLWFVFIFDLLFFEDCVFFLMGLVVVWFGLDFGVLFLSCREDFVSEEEFLELLWGLVKGVWVWFVLVLLYWIGLIILFGVLRCEILDGIWFIF